ncbi:MAG: response regulator [Desulfuromonadales bacterium]
MKSLIVEDEFMSRRVLKELLSSYGECDIAVNGREAVDSFRLEHEAKRPYNVIFMDIMMPVVDGLTALREIRALEKKMEIPAGMAVKVVMTTAANAPRTVIKKFNEGEANSFLVKPISREKLAREMAALELAAANRAVSENG